MRQCLCGRNEVECLEQTQKYLEKTSSINKYEVNKITLCRGHQQMKNIERTENCAECGSNKLEGNFRSIANSSEMVYWDQ